MYALIDTPISCLNLRDRWNAEYPGWLYAVKLGATTIWERWNSLDETGKSAENGMNSLNHYAYGSIAQWLYAADAFGVPCLRWHDTWRVEDFEKQEMRG